MQEAAFSADLIVIIAIAAFVIYKYRQVLGHKTGHDVENQPQRRNVKQERVVSLREFQKDIEEGGIIIDQAVEIKDDAAEQLEASDLKETIDQVKALEESFRLDDFLGGAKAAFEMVMDAFEKDDRTTLKQLLSDDLYREFDQELKEFSKQKKRPHTTLVSMMSANLVAACVDKMQAKLTVRFITEQIHVVKDEKGAIVEGDVSQIDQVEDEWTFERTLRTRNPNWTITDM